MNITSKRATDPQELQNSDRVKDSLSNEVVNNLAGAVISQLAVSSNTTRRPLPSFVNLSDPRVLRSYLDPELDQPSLHIASQIAENSSMRSIDDRTYGMSFPIHSEVLAHAMQRVKGKIVVEIAGASGDNSILLALAGAKKVYLNDIVPSEVQRFINLRKDLPPNIRDRLVPVPGNCFDLLKTNPSLANRVDLILCRNLIHFFTDEQQTSLLRLVKEVLKPGGKAIFATNATYVVLGEPSNHTSFNTTQCVISHPTIPPGISVIYRSVNPIPEHLISMRFEELYLYKRIDSKWNVFNEEFSKIDPAIRGEIKEVIKLKENQTTIKAKTSTAVRVVKSPARAYDMSTLPALLVRHGFEIDHTYVVKNDGHLVQSEDIVKKGTHVGVIIRSPASEK